MIESPFTCTSAPSAFVGPGVAQAPQSVAMERTAHAATMPRRILKKRSVRGAMRRTSLAPDRSHGQAELAPDALDPGPRHGILHVAAQSAEAEVKLDDAAPHLAQQG